MKLIHFSYYTLININVSRVTVQFLNDHTISCKSISVVTKYTLLRVSSSFPFSLHKNKKDDKISGLFSFRNQSHDINEFYSKRKLFFRMYIIFYCICPQGSSQLLIKLSFGLKEISNESKIFNIILNFFVPPTN